MATLFVVATPIGNLEDITLRAIRVLKEADIILAEDTRVAAKILSHLGITGKTVWRYDEHSHERMMPKVLGALRSGKNIALTTDAGTPGISDPGARLISYLLREASEIAVVPVPGPSALTAILSVAVIPGRFTFLGFPPHKKGRAAFFRSLAEHGEPVILFESPHRILKTLDEITAFCGPKVRIVLGRELTKIHEEIIRGTIKEVTDALRGRTIKGEIVLVVFPS